MWLLATTYLSRVEVADAGLLLKPRSFWRGRVEVGWSDVKGLQLVELKRRSVLVVETSRKNFAIVAVRPADHAALREVKAAARTAMAGLPDAAATMTSSEAEERAAENGRSLAVITTTAMDADPSGSILHPR